MRITEVREWKVITTRGQVGRSTSTVRCPFCDDAVVAYTWSWAGHGIKRCDCGARLHYSQGSTGEATL